MNHPSEWARYYDAPNGTYRYRHKGTGVVRDTLMNIGKRFKKKVTRQTLKKAVNEASKQMLKKAAEKAEEKAADKIQAVLRSGDSNSVAIPRPQGKKTPSVKPKSKKTPSVKPKGKKTPSVKPKGKKTPQRTLSTESRQKLKKMQSGVPKTKLSGDSRKKLNQILNAGRAAKLKVNQLIAEN